MNRFVWTSADTLAEAAAAASATTAQAMTVSPDTASNGDLAIVKAGGIDVVDLLKEGLLRPSRVVSLSGVPGLDEIAEEHDGSLRIGAMATLGSLAEQPIVRQRYPALANALNASASPQIRNVATLGGNLLQRPRCWYFRSHAFHCLRRGGSFCFAISGENQYHAVFDNARCAIVHPSTAASVLVALDAEVELTNAAGTTRRSPLENFFISPSRDPHCENDLKPQEIMTAVRLPRLPSSVRMAYLKQGEKDLFDWPLADVAVTLDIDRDRLCKRAAVVLGAAAPVPHRATAAECVLLGRRIDRTAADEAGRAAIEGATPLSKNHYKLVLFETLVRRAILAAAA